MALSDMQDKEQILRAARESKQLITRIASHMLFFPDLSLIPKIQKA